jgi:hypothetical protein
VAKAQGRTDEEQRVPHVHKAGASEGLRGKDGDGNQGHFSLLCAHDGTYVESEPKVRTPVNTGSEYTTRPMVTEVHIERKWKRMGTGLAQTYRAASDGHTPPTLSTPVASATAPVKMMHEVANTATIIAQTKCISTERRELPQLAPNQ